MASDHQEARETLGKLSLFHSAVAEGFKVGRKPL